MEKTTLSPCFKYLIRHAAKDEKELHRFAKLFFSLCNTRQIPAETAIKQYTSLRGSLVGVSHPVIDILTYKGSVLSPSDFRKAVMNDDSVISEPSCSEYVKEILGDDSVCRICHYTNGKYSNGNVQNEYKVLRYIYESSFNLNAFKENGNRANFFKSEIDLARELSYDYPVIVSVNRECAYKFVSRKAKSARDFYSLALPVGERLLSFERGVQEPLMKQDARVEDLQRINPNTCRTAWLNHIKEISSCPLISMEEFFELTRKGGKKQKTSVKDVYQLPIYEGLVAVVTKAADAVSSAPLPATNIDEAFTPDESEETISDGVPTGNSITVYEEGSIIDDAMGDMEELRESMGQTSICEHDETAYGDITEPLPEESFNSSVEPIEDGVSFADYSDADLIEEPDTSVEYNDADIYGVPSSIPCEQKYFVDSDTSSEGDVDYDSDDWWKATDDWGEPDYSESMDISKGQVPDDVYQSGDSGDESSINVDILETCESSSEETGCNVKFDNFNSPIILTLNELSSMAKPFEDVPEADRLSRSVAAEVVFCNGEYYILFFYFRSKEVLYTKASDITRAAGYVLSRKGVCIVTYQPYYIYSLARIYGFRVHNLYSIYSMDRLIFPKEKVSVRSEVMKQYIFDKEPEWVPECAAADLLSPMPLYSYIKSRQLLHSEKTLSVSALSVVLVYDELMGLSYLRDTDGYDPLFHLREDGSFEYVRTPVSDSAGFVSYEITEGDPSLFMYHCLMKYAESDRMWRSGSYIYSVDGNRVTICMPNETREKAITQISQHYYDYSISHDKESLVLEIS